VTLSEAKLALCRKLDIDYDKIAQNALFTEADLLDYIQTGTQLAWAYRLWEFTLDALKTAWNGSDTYLDYPNTFEDKSVYLLTVNDEEWGKRNFPDFKRYLSNNPTADDEIWSEFQRRIFPNTNALAVSDELCMYGKLRAPTLSLSADKLPFSPENDNDENSGNRAIVELAFGEALGSSKKKDKAGAEAAQKRAYGWLDVLWAPMDERDSVEQHQDRAFFENVPDFFGHAGTGRSTNIGNFP
jgi:hypothetical protein